MPADITRTVAQRIERLLNERQQHADALAAINQTLRQIGAALNEGGNGHRPGRKPAGAGNGAAGSGRKRRRRGRRSFSTTAEEFVIDFVRNHKNAVSRDINEAWKAEGRGHKADNTLSKLVKEKRLKRTPLGEGIRGSRYSVV
jgi:hypothetical protein